MARSETPSVEALAKLEAIASALDKAEAAKREREGKRMVAALEAANAKFTRAAKRAAGPAIGRYEAAFAATVAAHQPGLEAAHSPEEHAQRAADLSAALAELAERHAPLVRRLHKAYGHLRPSAEQMVDVFGARKDGDYAVEGGVFGWHTVRRGARRMRRDDDRDGGADEPRRPPRGNVPPPPPPPPPPPFSVTFTAPGFPHLLVVTRVFLVGSASGLIPPGLASTTASAGAGSPGGWGEATAALGAFVAPPAAARLLDVSLVFGLGRTATASASFGSAVADGFGWLQIIDSLGNSTRVTLPFGALVAPTFGPSVSTPGSPFAVPVGATALATAAIPAGASPFLVRGGLTVSAQVVSFGSASTLGLSTGHVFTVTAR